MNANPTVSGSYFNFGEVHRSQEKYPDTQEIVFSQQIYLDSEYMSHQRDSFNVFDFLGNIGGIIEIITWVATFFLASLPGRNSLLAIMNRLFVVKTSVDDMFEENKVKELIGESILAKLGRKETMTSYKNRTKS